MKLITLAVLGAMSVYADPWINGYYYGNWGQPVEGVPYAKYTHIVYACIAPNSDGTLDTSSAYMEDLPAFVWNAHLAGTKALIGIGDGAGWLDATSPDTRSTLVASIRTFIDQYDLDGVDLDWEHSISDSQYAAFIQDLRVAFGPTKVISMSAYGGDSNTPLASIVRAGPDQVDQVNLMTYDMDVYEAQTWFNCALHSGPNGQWSIEAAVEEFTTKGIPLSKLGVGVPFYGRRYIGPSSIGQSRGTKAGAWINYSDLVTSGQLSTDAQQYDVSFGAEYLSYPAEFWSFTGPRQIGDIVSWGQAQGIGGYMAFDLNMEYVPSASDDASTPLSTALRSAIDQAVQQEQP